MNSLIILLLCLLAIQLTSTQNWTQADDLLIRIIFGNNPNGSNIADRNKEPCECVPYYLCNNGTINTHGGNVFDVRLGEATPPVNQCPSILLFCCNKDDKVDKPIIPDPLPRRKGCGYSHPDGVGFRMTGDKSGESKFGEFPWMVAVQTRETNGTKYKCGGTLIHPRAVITAAHCVGGSRNKFVIRAGEWDTQSNLEIYEHQEVNVDKVIIHQQFYSGGLHNDIALLVLEEAFEYKDHIDVLCLPPQGYIVPDMTECIATGWGRENFDKKGKYKVILKKIGLPIMESNRCQDTLRRTRLGKHFLLNKSFICAGGEAGKDTCEGDGGSPLVCPIPGQEDRYLHAGIVAWGIDCGMNGIPGVYVNVPLFRDWIDEQMRNNDLDLTEYQY